MTRAISVTALLAALTLAACLEPGEYVYGDFLPDGQPCSLNDTSGCFVVYDSTEGISPSEAVLDDPNNPFRLASSGEDTRFFIQATGNPVGAFYSWATWLANVPTGENQYFSAVNLEAIWEQELAVPPDLELVRQMAVEAYTTVLEDFPDAGTFDVTGTLRFELLTPSYEAIIRLGGTPPPGWVLVEGEGGALRAVRQ